MKLSDEELAAIRANYENYPRQTTYGDIGRLLCHIDAIAGELSQAQAELAALRAGALGKKLVDANAVIICDEGLPDAMKFLAYARSNGFQDRSGTITLYRWALDRLKAAAAPQPPAQAVAVRVKPLVWEALSPDRLEASHYHAQTTLGPYEIQCDSEFPNWRGRWEGCWIGLFSPLYFHEIADAKAAAQADYERRILSAIDARPESAVKAEALRDVIGLIQEDADCDTANRAYNDGFKAGIAHAIDVIDANADRIEKEGGS